MYFAAAVAVGLIMDGLQILLSRVELLVFVFLSYYFSKIWKCKLQPSCDPHIFQKGDYGLAMPSS